MKHRETGEHPSEEGGVVWLAEPPEREAGETPVGCGYDGTGCYVDGVIERSPVHDRLIGLTSSVGTWLQRGSVRRAVAGPLLVTFHGANVLAISTLLAVTWLTWFFLSVLIVDVLLDMVHLGGAEPSGWMMVPVMLVHLVVPVAVWQLVQRVRGALWHRRLRADGRWIAVGEKTWPRDQVTLHLDGDRLDIVCGGRTTTVTGTEENLGWFVEQVEASPIQPTGAEEDVPAALPALLGRQRE